MNIPNLDEFVQLTHRLKATGTWRESVHVFDDRSAQAIRAALASGRPLLVRGEPGTGKSQLARAAAKVLNRRFMSQVVDAHTEIQDLWYRFDAVSRLGNAQVLSVTGKEKDVEKELEPERYLSPGILWWAFAWDDAVKRKCSHPLFQADETTDAQKGVVLLLDEIDKADADLPNSLLETLDNGKFTVPWINQPIGVSETDEIPRPLVIITTNEDRQLPGAFVRRCLVLDLSLPKKEPALIKHLIERAVFHFPKAANTDKDTQTIERNEAGLLIEKSRFDDDVLTEAASQLYQDRVDAEGLGVTPPGQAEYLDMLRILDELAPEGKKRQLELLSVIKDFALKKYPGMQQSTESDIDE